MAEHKFPWKVAWITGASGAICGEVAKRLAAAGVKVAATARPSEKLDALAAPSDNIKAFPADVLQPYALEGVRPERRERAWRRSTSLCSAPACMCPSTSATSISTASTRPWRSMSMA